MEPLPWTPEYQHEIEVALAANNRLRAEIIVHSMYAGILSGIVVIASERDEPTRASIQVTDNGGFVTFYSCSWLVARGPTLCRTDVLQALCGDDFDPTLKGYKTPEDVETVIGRLSPGWVVRHSYSDLLNLVRRSRP